MLDLLIIGAGPAGLSVGVEAVKSGLSCLILEKGTVVNSIVNFPKEMFFFSTSDLLEIGQIPFTSNGIRPTRKEAILYYQKTAEYYNIDIRTREKVIRVEQGKGFYKIHSIPWPEVHNENIKVYQARNVVIATGFYDCPKKLNIPGEGLSIVSHYYDEPYSYYKKDVLVVGGGNSAVEAALDIFRHGGKVTVLHRSGEIKKSIKYWILPDFQNRVAEGSIRMILDAEVLEIMEDGVFYQQAAEKKWFACNDVLLLTGYQPDEEIFRVTGVGYNSETLEPVVHKETFESTRKGIYLAGSLIAGVYSNRIFIENSRDHARPIIDDILRKGN